MTTAATMTGSASARPPRDRDRMSCYPVQQRPPLTKVMVMLLVHVAWVLTCGFVAVGAGLRGWTAVMVALMVSVPGSYVIYRYRERLFKRGSG